MALEGRRSECEERHGEETGGGFQTGVHPDHLACSLRIESPDLYPQRVFLSKPGGESWHLHFRKHPDDTESEVWGHS